MQSNSHEGLNSPNVPYFIRIFYVLILMGPSLKMPRLTKAGVRQQPGWCPGAHHGTPGQRPAPHAKNGERPLTSMTCLYNLEPC